MDEDSTGYVGFDVSKAKHAVAIAESGRSVGRSEVVRRDRSDARSG
jgi:hypothetical protein